MISSNYMSKTMMVGFNLTNHFVLFNFPSIPDILVVFLEPLNI